MNWQMWAGVPGPAPFQAQSITFGAAPPVFGGQPAVFGGQPNVFDGQTAVFGGQLAVFGGQPNVFGGQPVVFGGQSAVFGGWPNVFGGQPVVFGGQPAVFGGQPVVFGGHLAVFDGPPVFKNIVCAPHIEVVVNGSNTSAFSSKRTPSPVTPKSTSSLFPDGLTSKRSILDKNTSPFDRKSPPASRLNLFSRLKRESPPPSRFSRISPPLSRLSRISPSPSRLSRISSPSRLSRISPSPSRLNRNLPLPPINSHVSTATCSICCDDNKPMALLIPCGHSSMCGDCARRIQFGDRKCPFCRRAFTDIMEDAVKNG